MKDILILGIGNDILMDDGIGVKLVQKFQAENTNPKVTFETCMLGGFDVLDLIVGYKKVIIIDAIKTKDGTPGDIYYLQPADFKETLHLSNIHDVSFLNALRFGKKLKLDLPKKIDIIAIKIVEDRIFGNEFTPPLQAKYSQIIKTVRDKIFQLTNFLINGSNDKWIY